MKIFRLLPLMLLAMASGSCKKYLDAKPDATLSTPASLLDLQSLLDYYDGMNSQFTGDQEVLSDNYYITDADWASLFNQYEQNYYIWKKDDRNDAEWGQPYTNIYNCNLVLENIKTLSYAESDQLKAYNITGSALFFRSSYFYELAQLFCKGYNEKTASTDLGIVLKLSTDFTKKPVRATLQQTYDQIIRDLKASIPLLPLNSSLKTRPVKAAAYGSLARTYLSMQNYEAAEAYADSCLSISNALMDYNLLDSSSPNPIGRFNSEVIFQAVSLSSDPLSPYICKIDSDFYRSYSSNDLRKVMYYVDNGDGTQGFKGDYDGGSNNYGHCFTGIVTDEQYLIEAECDTRLGKIDKALQYLNRLLQKRYSSGNFIPVTETDPSKLLTVILEERRKELVFRGTRLTDLKRLNQDPSFAITLKRTLNGTLYILPPNDTRYVALIPITPIELSGLKQNP
jgi:tetratricopeptide (TPR) repeat protein